MLRKSKHRFDLRRDSVGLRAASLTTHDPIEDEIRAVTHTQTHTLLDAVAFAAKCAQHSAMYGRFGWMVRRRGERRTVDSYHLRETTPPKARIASGRTYGLEELARIQCTIVQPTDEAPNIVRAPASKAKGLQGEALMHLFGVEPAELVSIAADSGSHVDMLELLHDVASELLHGSVSADAPLMEAGLDYLAPLSSAIGYARGLARRLTYLRR